MAKLKLDLHDIFNHGDEIEKELNRVINSQGKVSLRAGAELQRELLEGEGVVFKEHARVDLKSFGW